MIWNSPFQILQLTADCSTGPHIHNSSWNVHRLVTNHIPCSLCLPSSLSLSLLLGISCFDSDFLVSTIELLDFVFSLYSVCSTFSIHLSLSGFSPIRILSHTPQIPTQMKVWFWFNLFLSSFILWNLFWFLKWVIGFLRNFKKRFFVGFDLKLYWCFWNPLFVVGNFVIRIFFSFFNWVWFNCVNPVDSSILIDEA